jgi:acyl-CoA dehydrogenase
MNRTNTALRALSEIPDAEGNSGLAPRVGAVAEIAAACAAEVDRDARFPREAIDMAREHRLMGIAVPRELGGEDASLSAVADVCFRLGQACASTAMIYAMHQIKVACIVRHGSGAPWHEAMLRHLCRDQLLLASSTTEGQGGGNVRSSAGPIERDGDIFTLERAATVISYGADADGIVTTARRAPDALPTDQVLVVLLREHYSLDPILAWNTLGMRGTCSAGFTLKATGVADQILPVPYDKIHVQTMTPIAHLTWASVWAGIAAASVDRARQFIRGAARKAGGQLPPGAKHFTKANASLTTLRGLIASGIERYQRAADDERKLASLDFQTMIGLTKVEASELAVSTVMSALRACGLSGYRNDSEFSIGRHLRDVLSSPLMINNDRILSDVETASLMGGMPSSLGE